MTWFPFVTRSHHDDVVQRLEKQLADVQSERKAYLDTLAQMGFGVKFFATEEKPETEVEETPEKHAASPTVPITRMRPSAIMRSMDAKKQREYDQKMNVRRKEQVLTEVAAIIGDTLPQQA